ncbi:SMP-30/gluconolactonase/LRE family protein [Teredinibacter turnerae]|uniref:SMP-30/gluconolactonase/LRE family protein n=1 Tax=Teredinibacter turnerae TaxID=2426 RepID=UPI000376C410|nr:SMP-30/gluconolactonase/LRE family protein [Teredinibacter turnerae]
MLRSASLLLLTSLLLGCAPELRKGPSGTNPFRVEQLNLPAFELAEGPTWDGGDLLFFTDIFASKLYKYNLRTGELATEQEATDAANGMAMDDTGKLWICTQELGRITLYDPKTATLRPLLRGFHGKRFNHPNDITLDDHGGAYFTDPAWDPVKHRHQPVNGIYYVGHDGEAHLLDADLDKPNGILLSKNGKFLYVVDMGTNAFLRYPVVQPGVVAEPEAFATLNTEGVSAAAPDGLEEDAEGNIYVATENGIQVFTPTGQFLYRVALPQRPTNLEFIDRAQKEMIVTSANYLFRLRRE